MALVILCLIVLLVIPTAVALSQIMFVLPCGCPNSSSVILAAVASLALLKIPASSASAADDTTFSDHFG